MNNMFKDGQEIILRDKSTNVEHNARILSETASRVTLRMLGKEYEVDKVDLEVLLESE